MQLFGWLMIVMMLIIVALDIVPIAAGWLGRLHIGRWNDHKSWAKRISSLGTKWLNRTPKVQVTDQTRWTIIERWRGTYASRTIQHWQQAALLLGLAEQHQYERDERIEAAVSKFLRKTLDEEGGWRHKPEHVDVGILAYALMKQNTGCDQPYERALDETWELIQAHIGTDGTVQYRKGLSNYRYVDTIGFICPFLVAYGKRYNKPECIALAVKQIVSYVEHGMSKEHFLPCHAYAIDHNIPLGLYGWGRGLGWFAIGLIDTWNELPRDDVAVQTLEPIIEQFARTLMTFQRDDGSWSWTVTRECRSDSSATATLAWFLLNASQIDAIKTACLHSCDKALLYLMKVTRRRGAVDFSQGDTKDIGVYSMLFNILPFTQGFSMRTINLLLQRKSNV